MDGYLFICVDTEYFGEMDSYLFSYCGHKNIGDIFNL